jgi:type IV pilus assembly protein PilV
MMRMIGTAGNAANQREGGFTLIEVMFASVYLAFGLLTIAAMEDIALSRNMDARRMSIATNLAVEMMERIRFNSPANAIPLVLGGYVYQNIQACNFACPGGSTPGNATATNNALANGDYNQWLARLSATDSSGQPVLPNAIGTVTSTAVANPSALAQVQITVAVQYSTSIRTPTITITTLVAPL